MDSVKYYITHNKQKDRHNVAAFVDAWLVRNIDKGNNVIKRNYEHSYNEYDISELSILIELTAEGLVSYFQPTEVIDTINTKYKQVPKPKETEAKEKPYKSLLEALEEDED